MTTGSLFYSSLPKKAFSIKITDIIIYARKIAFKKEFQILKKSFLRLENTAKGVQELGNSHLIEPEHFALFRMIRPKASFLNC